MYYTGVPPGILKKISRTEAGTYRCIASNGVGNPVSRTLRVDVACEYMYMHVVYSFLNY